MTTQPHAIDLQLIKRLTELSRRGYYDPYQRFYWPEQIDKECLWCDEDLLTTYGTELHSSLSQQTLAALSQSEAINFYSLNVHGIKGALEFIMRCIYDARYRDISEYLHLFITEENTHMWFFAKFCIDYYGKIYPAATMPESRVSNPIEKDLYMFASTLIFEEYVDFYNHKVGRNIQVPAIVREINHQHHVDESRHVSFGREVVKSIYGELAAADDSGDVTTRVGRTIERIFIYFIGLMYNPRAYEDANIVSLSGLANAAALRNRLRNDRARSAFHQQWFKRTADFFIRQGMLADASCLSR